MKIAGLVLGIIGGLFGLVSASCVAVVGEVVDAVGVEEGNSIAIMGYVGFASAILAIVASSFAITKPKIASLVMIICGILILVSTGVLGIIPFIMIGIGALLTFLDRNSVKNNTQPAAPPPPTE
jgi:hypothetical protein